MKWKLAALILGILGGVGALISSIILIGQAGSLIAQAAVPSVLIGMEWAAVILALIGITGGALALSKPTIAGILMLISGIGEFIPSRMDSYLVIGAYLLIFGGILALYVGKYKARP